MGTCASDLNMVNGNNVVQGGAKDKFQETGTHTTQSKAGKSTNLDGEPGISI